METKVFSKNNVTKICSLFLQGEVVALPTETIYGLATIEKSVDKLYDLKKRDGNKPIAYLVHDKNEISKYANVNKRNAFLIDKLLPGPLTVVLDSNKENKTIGFRVSEDEFLSEIAKKCHQPILLTSANISSTGDLFDFESVYNLFNGKIAGVVNGKCASKIASTVIDLTKDEVVVLREGAIATSKIMNLVEEYERNENSNSL